MFSIASQMNPLLAELQAPERCWPVGHVIMLQFWQVPGLAPDRYWLARQRTFGESVGGGVSDGVDGPLHLKPAARQPHPTSADDPPHTPAQSFVLVLPHRLSQPEGPGLSHPHVDETVEPPHTPAQSFFLELPHLLSQPDKTNDPPHTPAQSIVSVLPHRLSHPEGPGLPHPHTDKTAEPPQAPLQSFFLELPHLLSQPDKTDDPPHTPAQSIVLVLLHWLSHPEGPGLPHPHVDETAEPPHTPLQSFFLELPHLESQPEGPATSHPHPASADDPPHTPAQSFTAEPPQTNLQSVAAIHEQTPPVNRTSQNQLSLSSPQSMSNSHAAPCPAWRTLHISHSKLGRTLSPKGESPWRDRVCRITVGCGCKICNRGCGL